MVLRTQVVEDGNMRVIFKLIKSYQRFWGNCHRHADHPDVPDLPAEYTPTRSCDYVGFRCTSTKRNGTK